MRLPLFPLNAHVLPEGRLSLRIFEARYLRMIRERAGSDPCFAMGMLEELPQGGSRVLELATVVRMVDFNQLEDGLLGITVEGIKLVRVSNIGFDDDGLRWADCEPFDLWPEELAQQDARVQQSLMQLLAEYPEIGRLYPHPERYPLRWCLQRWLELLPIEPAAKASLLSQRSPVMALALIHSILDKSDP